MGGHDPDPDGRPRVTADFPTTGSLLRRTLQTCDGVGQLLRSEERKSLVMPDWPLPASNGRGPKTAPVPSV